MTHNSWTRGVPLRDEREDFSLMNCSERLNGPHCPHQIHEQIRVARMVCCWCGSGWDEPRSQAADRHGPWLPSRTREGRSH